MHLSIRKHLFCSSLKSKYLLKKTAKFRLLLLSNNFWRWIFCETENIQGLNFRFTSLEIYKESSFYWYHSSHQRMFQTTFFQKVPFSVWITFMLAESQFSSILYVHNKEKEILLHFVGSKQYQEAMVHIILEIASKS